LLERKIFPADKNYLLKEAQALTRNALLKNLARDVKQHYLRHYNPLGLIDDTITKIKESGDFPLAPFHEFYHDLAAIYRFEHGEVQLGFLFDGSTHLEKYQKDWEDFFTEQIQSYLKSRFFIRAVLDISVFHKTDRVAFLAGARLKYFLIQWYEMKVYKFRGIQKVRKLTVS